MASTQPRASTRILCYRDLLVWQKGIELVVEVYRLAKRLPKSERFELATQMKSAAVSIPTNIAEGHGRDHLGDYLRHLSIANGSLMELETELIIAKVLDFLQEAEVESVLSKTTDLGRMLAALTRRLKQRRVDGTP